MRPVVSDTPYKHIFIMDDGRAMIGGTRIKVEYIVSCSETWGQSPQEIQEGYPFLTMGQIYSALAYYHDNKALVDRLIRETEEYAEKMRALYSSNMPTRAELLERLRAKKAMEKTGAAAVE